MSNVTLHIGGRDYTVACDAGQEAHITGLGRVIEGKLQGLSGNAGMSETRQLLFAALILADELHEAGGGKAVSTGPTFDPARLEAIASKLESCAASLED
jgi:cell division protein ZapA